MAYEQEFCTLLICETRRRLFEEGVPRIFRCLDLLPEDTVWYRPNEHTVAVGNQILHLCGNVRQWVLSGLGDEPDNRNRDREFDDTQRVSKDDLRSILLELQRDVEHFLEHLKPDLLLKPYQIQGFDETGLSVLVHVIEHFSYHVGQITYITKATQNTDTGYYTDMDLNETVRK